MLVLDRPDVKDRVAQIIEKNRRCLVGHAYRIVQDQHAAEDVVQDAFFRVCKKPPSSTTEKEWLEFIQKVVRNLALNWKRNQKVSSRPASGVDMNSVPEKQAESEFTQEDIDLADWFLTRLPREWRMVIEMVVLEGMTRQEVADELGVPLTTVINRLHQGRQELRRLAEQRRGHIHPRTALGVVVTSGVAAVCTKVYGWLKSGGVGLMASTAVVAMVVVVGLGLYAGRAGSPPAAANAEPMQPQRLPDRNWEREIDQRGETMFGGQVVGKNGTLHKLNGGVVRTEIVAMSREPLADGGQGWRVVANVDGEAEYEGIKQWGIGGGTWDPGPPRKVRETAQVTFIGRAEELKEVEGETSPKPENPVQAMLYEALKAEAAKAVAEALPKE